MLKHWSKLLNTDCVVVDIGAQTIYPIYRTGSTTLLSVADKKYVNYQISKCRHIDVLLRDPGERFVSGLNEYCRNSNTNVSEAWHLTEQGKLIDRHFAPQYLWLLHLSKFYKGSVTLKPFSDIKKITNAHEKKSKGKKVSVPLLKTFVEIDYNLINLIGQTVDLVDLIRKYKNVLS